MLVEREKEYILAARTLGYSTWRIVFRHALPNVLRASIVFSMADIVLNILLLSALSYLGLGAVPPTPEWGAMVADGKDVILTAWWVATLPGLVIVLVGVGFSLIGDGIADRLGRGLHAHRGCRCGSTNGRPEPGSELLEVRDLTIAFPAGDAPLLAADRVGFSVEAGQTVGLVGESGCGKSVTLRSLLRAGARIRARSSPGRSAGSARTSRQASKRRIGEVRGSRDLDDLPGPDLVPEPGVHGRRPDDRDAAQARRAGPREARDAGDRAARPRRRARRRSGGCAPIRTSSAAACASG